MLPYLLRRLGVSLVVLAGLSVLAFFVIRLAPGDAVTAMLGAHYNEAEALVLREKYGLDRPLIVQYGLWVSNIMRGDLGESLTGRPVWREIADALPVTLQLMAMSMAIAIFIGVPLGIIAAVKRNQLADYAANTVSLIGLSVPGFWLGTLLILLFSLAMGWLPSGGFVPVTEPWANFRHMIMPGFALGAAVAAVLMRVTRTAMIEVLDQDFIRAARGKGVGRMKLLLRHALSNAMIPVLTIVGLQAGYLIGGSIVIEEVFSLNGVGRLVLRSVTRRDYLTLQACILLIGATFLAINLAVDIGYTWLDPRIRVEGD